MTIQATEPQVASPEAIRGAAYAYAAQQQAAQSELIVAALAAWALLDLRNPVPSWVAGVGQRIYVMLSILQELMASDAHGYVRRVLAMQGQRYTGPAINPRNFAGIASDGRDLESLLAGAVVHVRKAQDQGLSDAEAASRGANFLRMVLATQTSDQARAAESVSLTASGTSAGWVRLLTPPSCGRCAVLAGRFYRWSDGFERHPMCFPAGTVVSGPRVDAATRRWFEGELVTIRTASGQELSLTANHPVLTHSGWLPARLLVPGMEVFRSLGAQSALGQVPDDQQMPALVEDVFSAFGVAGLAAQVPSAAEDFHGDGSVGEVDVVSADRHLGLQVQSEVGGHFPEGLFSGGAEASLFHSGAGGLGQRLLGVGAPSGGVVRSAGLGESFGVGHLARAEQARFGLIADLDALLQQAGSNGGAADVVLLAEAVLALASRVLRRDVIDRDIDGTWLGSRSSTRWDAPAGPLTMKSADGYTERGRDLLNRLTGQIAADRIVEVVRREWSGHVFNLTSSEGWLSAGNLITSNCDCRHIPCVLMTSDDLTTNPYTYFNSLSTEQQDRLFGKAQAQAIRDGADINQVVNASARPGAMFTADNGRRYTREGTTRRGTFGQSRQPGRVLRPTPLQIYRDAKGNREAAIEMLRRFRYIL